MNLASAPMAFADTLLANLPVGILVYEGKTGRCVLANQTAADMLGLNVENLLQLNFRDFASRCQLDESMLSGKQSGHQVVTYQPDFDERVTLDCFISWFEIEGEPHLMCTVTDITERKRTQEKLEGERALLRCLIDSASDLIFIKDRNSVYQACNKASEEFIGMPESEQIGKSDYDFFDHKKAEEIRKLDRRVLDEGNPLHVEEWVTDGNGRRLLMDTVKSPYYDPDGKPLGLVGIGRDVTERKRLEQDRMAHLGFLENMDRVHRAIQSADDLETSMKDLLDVVLSIFDCDRAILLYPCDPEALAWSIPMDRTKTDLSGGGVSGPDMPMDPEVAKALRLVLESDRPVTFDPESKILPPAKLVKRFGMKSCMAQALHPANDKPWEFALLQCAYARVWTLEEVRLFQEIGRRFTDGLSTMMAHRELRTSLEKLEQAQRIAHIGSWELDLTDNRLTWSNEVFRILEIDPEKSAVSYEAFLESVHPEDREAVNTAYTASLKSKTPFAVRCRLLFPDGRIKHIRGQCEADYEGGKAN
ncbi:MAG: PAS domain-containing protein [Desulfobacteraceae bacterium]